MGKDGVASGKAGVRLTGEMSGRGGGKEVKLGEMKFELSWEMWVREELRKEVVSRGEL